YNPFPADGATSVHMNVTLSWTPGLGAKLFIVYFGDNFDDVHNSVGGLPQAMPTYTPGLLEPDKTYYWRVDEFDAVETSKGDVWSFKTREQILAFPGAEGAGRYSTGGRGGDVYHVTNLNDSGAGSLRYGLNLAAGPRIIVFDVSGNIELQSDLSIGSDITIAGQTAPGDGITICNRQTTLRSGNVIVRYIRFRPGDVYCPGYEPDSLSIRGANNVIVDHVSTSWGIDEVLSATHGSSNVTVQWSMVTEALHNSCHQKGNHGYGSLINGGDFTFHHNLYAHNNSRNPRPGAGEGTRLDWVNNVVYNPGGKFGYGDGSSEIPLYINYVCNYGIGGPNTRATAMYRSTEPYTHIYQSGNLMDLNKNGILDGRDNGWDMFSGPETHHGTGFNLPEVTTHSALEAYNLVVAEAGASLVRDAVDNRVIETVRNQTGAHIDSQREVGGWPELNSEAAPLDTDQDGMPDDWELAQGLDPYKPSDANGDRDGDGYTNIEEYINWIPRRQK
ncbi:MAG: pectate lyase family protein, partial [Planctomycetota bacterium]